MKRITLLIGLLIALLPAAGLAKTKDTDCKGQGNRLFYARCVNRDLEKRPLVKPMLHRMTETVCSGKTGSDFVGCMKVQERLRQIERNDASAVCNMLDGMAKRLCDANGAPTGTGRLLNIPISRVVPQWNFTRRKSRPVTGSGAVRK